VFRALAAPLFIYGALLPVTAYMTGAGLDIVLGLTIGTILLGFTALKLWSQANQTKRREEAALAEADRRRAEAESAVAAKSAFVAMVSHELRTPISAILAGAAELERISGGVGRSHARLISDAGGMMRTLLNDLLDLAKLDAGRMAVESVSYDFRALMSDQMRFWRAEAMKKDVALRLTGARGAPGWVHGDPMRLRQILNNLLSNALKFTDEGSVTVSIASEALADGRIRLEIEVADTGAGMTPAQIDRLFQPFEQADSSIARTHGGTGLGLVISRQLARMMDGDIRVESTHGEGSRFIVALPVACAEAVPVPAAEAEPVAAPTAMSVLVVDDHDINRRALSLMQEPLGAEVSLAASGAEALGLLAMRPYDVVLMDVHMPDMTGREAVARLRQEAGPNRSTPVIAVTGATEPADVQACLACGMNDWVAKPVDAAQLYNALARQLGQGEDEAAAA
jgi:signal transduction histidine kinase/CheY-like chemotaxis protein